MSKRFIRSICAIVTSAVLLLTVIAVAPITDSALAAQAPAEQPVRPMIAVSGTGRVTAQPDQATISIGVQISAPTLEAATTDASARMMRVLDAIKAQGVDAKEIQTSFYTVNPITTYRENQPPEVTGYEVMNVVSVKVNNMANLGVILDAGMTAGANYLGGVTFGVANPTHFETEARTLAVQDAQHVAEVLAQAAGVRLGPVISITEGVSNVQPPLPILREAADSISAGPVQSGSLDITVYVTVRYEIAE